MIQFDEGLDGMIAHLCEAETNLADIDTSPLSEQDQHRFRAAFAKILLVLDEYDDYIEEQERDDEHD